MKAIILPGTGEKAGQFWYHLTASNGKIIAQSSEHYTRKANCIKTVQRNFPKFIIHDTTLKTH